MMLSLAGCGDIPGGFGGARAVTLEITPSASTLTVGSRVQLTAHIRHANGKREPAKSVELTASEPGVVEFDGQTIVGRQYGIVSIGARSGTLTGHALVVVSDRPASQGPLRRDPRVRRYFIDRNGHAVYLTGSHTWTNFQDSGPGAELPKFDYASYLDDLQSSGHNLIRLWVWEQAKWVADQSGDIRNEPVPFQRTGPGTALDGQPRFDLTRFNPNYFARLRTRVEQARERGIFVAVMLFNGWSLEPKGPARENPWRGHPLNRDNNINGVDGDPARNNHGAHTHRLHTPRITEIQQDYVRRVVETLDGLDNVLYEVSNESTAPSIAWQTHWVNFVHALLDAKTVRQPIGVSAERPGESNDALFASGADWVAPFRTHTRPLEPFAWHGEMVLLNDTDHLCGVCGSIPWAWRALTRGQNPIMMDPYNAISAYAGGVSRRLDEEDWPAIRRTMGWTRVVAEWIDVGTAEPFGGLCSSGYMLARTGSEPERYVAYLNEQKDIMLFGGRPTGWFTVRWLELATGKLHFVGEIQTSGEVKLEPPFHGDGVLLLERSNRPT